MTQEITIPEIFEDLFIQGKYRYKIYEGGRGGGKSESFSRALLLIACQRQVRILCTREIQKSIQDSVHKTLKDIINNYVDISSKEKHIFEDFETTQTTIRNLRTGSEFIFCGLSGNAQQIKSMANIDICWVEEAQTVSKDSLNVLIPTIRKENSEIWFSFNRLNDIDPVYDKFCLKPYDDILHKVINYYDNPYFPDVLEKERLRDEENLSPEDYNHIWLGKPSSNIDSTFYGYYMAKVVAENRICGALYNLSCDVHTAWDLGIADNMSIVFYQVFGNEIRFIDYYENTSYGMEHYANVLRDKAKEYNYKYGLHFAPHDVRKRNLGRDAISTFEVSHRMGIDFEILPRHGITEGIQLVRHNFNRYYFEKEFCKRLIQCLKQYRKKFNKDKNTYEGEYHDEYSHGADAFRYAIQSVEYVSKTSGQAKTDIEYKEEYEDYYRENYSIRDNVTGY